MNIFDLPQFLPQDTEIVDILEQGKNVRIERIISSGQTSGWYNQEQAELVVLVAGRAELTYSDQTIVKLKAGDTLLIPPHKKHRVSYTSKEPPCVWLCIFFTPGVK